MPTFDEMCAIAMAELPDDNVNRYSRRVNAPEPAVAPKSAHGSARIYLSSPDVGAVEREALLWVFDSGWVAPVGPEPERCPRPTSPPCRDGTAGSAVERDRSVASRTLGPWRRTG